MLKKTWCYGEHEPLLQLGPGSLLLVECTQLHQSAELHKEQNFPGPELNFPGYDLDEVKLKMFLTRYCLCLNCEVGWGEIKDISNKVKYCYQGTVHDLNLTWKGSAALELVASLFFFWPGLQKQKLSQTGVGDNLALSESLE